MSVAAANIARGCALLGDHMLPAAGTCPFRLRSLLAFAVGMVWPTLESMKAIESKGVGDDTQVCRRGWAAVPAG